MRPGRRAALRWLAIGAATPSLVGPVRAGVAKERRFRHGVAAGDPSRDGMVIWTRVTLVSTAPCRVPWEVAEDARFRQVVQRGVAVARASGDFTVKVEVEGLQPGRDYWYRFKVADERSPEGRARTLPDAGAEELVLAVASCANTQCGRFHAYDAIARLDRLDAVIHLGDYLYEDGVSKNPAERQWAAAAGRAHFPAHEIRTLADYRARHAQYKSDPHLQAAHARAAWICAWDDHESANDCWAAGAKGHKPDEGVWDDRRAAAIRAYYEWMPVRDPRPGRPAEAIYRSFRFGDLASLSLMETRLTARAHQLDYVRDLADEAATPERLAAFRTRLAAPGREMLGARQASWLKDDLAGSAEGGVAWQLLGSQVVMARIDGPDVKRLLGPAVTGVVEASLPGKYRQRAAVMSELFAHRMPHNLDAWDGYPAARERLYGACRETRARPIVLSGDSHAFWANALADASGAPVGVEFATTSITSPGVSDRLPGLPVNRAFRDANPEVRFCDHAAKGFIQLTVRRDRVEADYLAVSSIRASRYRTRRLQRFRVDAERPAELQLVSA